MAVNPDRSVRLNTWKEIAAFLGRDERTAKRWEATRNLPVRRMPGGRSTVYAYAHELNDWLARGHADVAEPGPATAATPLAMPVTARRWRLIAGAAAAAAVAAILFVPHPVRWRGASSATPDLYLQGVYAWNTRTHAGLTDAIADFSRVILDRPDYAPAYAGLADCYNLMPEYGGMNPAQAYPQAKVAALRAVALDDRLAGAHRALGFVDFWWSHDVAASQREFARALALDPNAAQTHHWYGNTLAMTGAAARGVAELDTALRLDPTSTVIRADRANALFIAGRRREAIDQLEAIASARPDFATASRYLAVIHTAAGDAPRAVAAQAAAARASGDPGERAVAVAAQRGLAEGGAAGAARAVLAVRRTQFDAGQGSPYALAQSEAMVDPGTAIALLETSLTRGESAVMGIAQDPALRPLRADPRFRALEARLHLPPAA